MVKAEAGLIVVVVVSTSRRRYAYQGTRIDNAVCASRSVSSSSALLVLVSVSRKEGVMFKRTGEFLLPSSRCDHIFVVVVGLLDAQDLSKPGSHAGPPSSGSI